MFAKGFPAEVRTKVYKAQNGYCKHCHKPMAEVHHMLHNTSLAREMTPMFVHSPFNAVGLCHACHDSAVISQYRISLDQALVYEGWFMEIIEEKKDEWKKSKSNKKGDCCTMGCDTSRGKGKRDRPKKVKPKAGLSKRKKVV